MAMRAQWTDGVVFSDCPRCQHLGPHQPDALGMITCDVCGTTFAAAEASEWSGDPAAPPPGARTEQDTRPEGAITASWVPHLPDGVADGG